jgi:hypothetical protein
MRAVALAIAVVGAFASIAYYGTEQKRGSKRRWWRPVFRTAVTFTWRGAGSQSASARRY